MSRYSKIVLHYLFVWFAFSVKLYRYHGFFSCGEVLILRVML